MSGNTRSANATVSDANASQTTTNGILYAPSSFCAHSMSRVPPVFIAEFHAMFAMNSSSVSIGYGSPATALAITMCIMPCAAIGDSHEYALSMRSGPPSASIASLRGSSESRAARARAACRACSVAGSCCGGIGFGYGARARKLPGPSSAPSSICSRCSARHVWKPFECAEMPRIAYIATGRPTTLSCRPQTSVQRSAARSSARTRPGPSRARAADRRGGRRSSATAAARKRRRGSARPPAPARSCTRGRRRA